MRTLEFTKMVASGNDFIVVDNSNRKIADRHLKSLARELCNRNFGIGADGLLLVEASRTADFRMRVVNPDGSEAEMCGNGARCVALFALERRLAGKKMKIETMAGPIEAEVLKKRVRLKMSEPKNIRLGLQLTIEEVDYTISFVHTGVPHAVIFVEHIEKINVKRIGNKIRYHEAFSPRGTNVDFVKVEKGNSIKVRTYERGVEDETLACGTGVVASAIISAISKRLKSPIGCLTKSGERLKVYFNRTGNNFKSIYLEGSTKTVFYGAIPLA